MTEQKSLKQEYDGQILDHVIVHDGTGRTLPTVIILPTVMGVQPLEIGFAEKLVALGYHVLVSDLFGRRFTLGDREAAFAAMGQLRADRAALRQRLLAVVEEVRKREHVDKGRIAVIGYCFGGQCALDVARAGTDVAAVASFHGLFDPPGLPPQPIKAKVAAYHGWDDPMVPPEAVVALGKDDRRQGGLAIHAYSHVGHGFPIPKSASWASGRIL
jgi:dienelactone hydrolase